MIQRLRLFGKVSKKASLRGIRCFGFTLIEVLISLVLLGLGLSFSAKVFVAGKYFIKESENKTRAMEIASVHMNEYLTKSFDELKDGDTRTIDGFTSTATVNTAEMSPPAGSTKVNIIPYKNIEVVCSYNEQNINGVRATKSVRLLNMVVYPYMHLYSLATSPTNAEAKCYGTPCTTNAAVAATNSSATIMYVDFETKVQSDLLIFYNISMNVANSANIGASDLILTKCFITPINAIGGSVTGASTAYDIQTGTPIMTQPTINNTVSVSNLPKGIYQLKVVWFKDKDHHLGKIMGKKANVVIFQVEK